MQFYFVRADAHNRRYRQERGLLPHAPSSCCPRRAIPPSSLPPVVPPSCSFLIFGRRIAGATVPRRESAGAVRGLERGEHVVESPLQARKACLEGRRGLLASVGLGGYNPY